MIIREKLKNGIQTTSNFDLKKSEETNETSATTEVVVCK